MVPPYHLKEKHSEFDFHDVYMHKMKIKTNRIGFIKFVMRRLFQSPSSHC